MKWSNRKIAVNLVAVAIGMFGLAYASVPLYKLFCEFTGFEGTPRIASSNQTEENKKRITVRFDANTDENLPWEFEPDAKETNIALGATKTINYKARNKGAEILTGTATFNIVPEKAAPYFNKIQCFCFEKQQLAPGESKELPVVFFVDPEIAKDPKTSDIDTITLSYTFFKAKK